MTPQDSSEAPVPNVLEPELGEIARHVASRRCEVRLVGIQVPDGLKRAAVALARAVESRLGVGVVLSVNPCFGACDLDDALLSMVDVLFHIGHTPMVRRRNVVYLPHRLELPWREAVEAALPLLPGGEDRDEVGAARTTAALGIARGEDGRGRAARIGLITTAQHLHQLPRVRTFLRQRGFDVVVERGRGGVQPGQVLGCNLSAAPRNADAVLYLGTGAFHPLGVALSTGLPVVQADLELAEARRVDADEFRKRRYLTMARALDARRWGIIVGEKAGQRLLPVALELKRKVPGAVLLAMDSITPASLEGLPMDAYAVCACPRVALDDGPLYPKPMLTPGEVLVIAGERRMEDVDFFWGWPAGG